VAAAAEEAAAAAAGWEGRGDEATGEEEAAAACEDSGEPAGWAQEADRVASEEEEAREEEAAWAGAAVESTPAHAAVEPAAAAATEREEADAGAEALARCFFIGSPPSAAEFPGQDPALRPASRWPRTDVPPVLAFMEQALEEARLRASAAEVALAEERARRADLEAHCSHRWDYLLSAMHTADVELIEREARLKAREEVHEELQKEQRTSLEREWHALEATRRELLLREARAEGREQALRELEEQRAAREHQDAALQTDEEELLGQLFARPVVHAGTGNWWRFCLVTLLLLAAWSLAAWLQAPAPPSCAAGSTALPPQHPQLWALPPAPGPAAAIAELTPSSPAPPRRPRRGSSVASPALSGSQPCRRQSQSWAP